VLGYDGDQPVRTGADNDTYGWTFLQGPGLDDPLIAFSPGYGRFMFYVTDGAGRQYAVGDRSGFDMLSDPDYQFHGPKFAGGTIRSSTYGAERFPQNTQPGLSFFRNRFYDQQTGRWTQEDPIGVAGGVNLYQFNGNNPVMFTDPFGLKECEQRGNCTQGDGGVMEARGVAMRRSDVIEPTDASPLFFIGGIQREEGAAAAKVVSVSEEFVSRAIERGVKPAAIMDALRNPLKVGEIVTDALGRPSQQFIGRQATVVRNPETGNLVNLWRTSTKRVQKLLKELGEE
jgi:RHS repeat-associated protein